MEALIKHNILEWAMRRASITADILAQKIGKSKDDVEKWLSGEKRPTFKQARKIAKILQVPFGYFYLDSPPKEELPIPDFRTFDDEPKELSLTTKELLYRFDRKQEWLREFFIENGYEPLEFVGKFDWKNTNINFIARYIEKWISITEIRKNSKTKEEYLKNLIDRIEANRIFVARNSLLGNNTHQKIDLDEIRGAVFVDEYAPFIYINSNDTKSAQVFTLMHELVHILIGQSAISDISFDRESPVEIEKFCNQTAAEVLLPRSELIHLSARINFDIIKDIANKHYISPIVVLRKLLDIGKIDKNSFFRYYEIALQEFEENRSTQRSSGGDFYKSILARNSKTFSHYVVMAALEGRLPLRDAADLLDTKPTVVVKIGKKIGI